MTDEINNDGAEDETATDIPERDLASLMPRFGPLAPLVKMLYDAHREYVIAHAAKFGAETPKFAAWRDNLSTVDVDILTDTPDEMSDDYDSLMPLYDAVRLSSDANYVASLIGTLSELLSLARENLQGIYYGAKRSENVDTSDIAALRSTLDSYYTSVSAIAETPQLDMKDVAEIIPVKVKTSTKTGAKRTVYDGPNIPQTRKVDALRKNARLCVVVETDNGGTLEWHDVAGENFGEQCKAIGLTIAELREQYGVKLDEIHTLPSGRRFYLRRVDK